MKTLKMSLVISSLLFTSSCYADNIADTIASLQKQIDALKKEVAAVHNNSKGKHQVNPILLYKQLLL